MKTPQLFKMFHYILNFPHQKEGENPTTRDIYLFDNVNTPCKVCMSFSTRILALEENFLLQFQMDVSVLYILFLNTFVR